MTFVLELMFVINIDDKQIINTSKAQMDNTFATKNTNKSFIPILDQKVISTKRLLL